MIYPQYAITVAHANDFAAPDEFVKIAGGLLLLLGVGTMVGPFLAAQAMEHFIPEGLFAFTAASHVLLLPLHAVPHVAARAHRPGRPSAACRSPRAARRRRASASTRGRATRRTRMRPSRRLPTRSTSPPRSRRRPASRRRSRRPDCNRGRPSCRKSRLRRLKLPPIPEGAQPNRDEPTPATDDEIAPSTPGDGGTEAPR